MKKFTLLFAVILCATFAFGQNLVHKKTKSIPVKGEKIEITKEIEIIWENDFSTTEDWTMEFLPGNPNDGPWVIGTAGPAGSFSEGMGAIESTTAENGFAMYDSDAIAVEEGTQDSKITYVNTIDCTDYDKVAVQFESYYRRFHGTPYVEISIDGIDWTQYQVHSEVETNGSTANPKIEVVNITAVAANQATVYIRFRYIGEWDYAWMVDDVKMYVAPDYDVELVSTRINFWNEFSNFGYSGFYSQIPAEQIEGIDLAYTYFTGIIKNNGSIASTPILHVSVTNPANEVVYEEDTVFTSTITTALSDTLILEDLFYFDPATLGTYTFNISADLEEGVDENIANNSLSFSTEITSNTYAHDNGTMTGSWSTCNYTDGCKDGDIIGVEYQLFKTTKINHVDLMLSTMTVMGTSMYIKVMLWDEEGSAWVEASGSEFITIESEDQLGDIISIELDDQLNIEVPEGEFVKVLAAVQYYTNEGADEFRLAIDGTAPTSGFETWMYFAGTSEWFFYGGTHVPFIRLNVGEESSVENFTKNEINMYPNPSTGIVTISNVEGASIEIINLMGQVVESIENANETNTIDLSNNANGTYIVKIVNGNEISTSKFNLAK